VKDNEDINREKTAGKYSPAMCVKEKKQNNYVGIEVLPTSD
jgi:hypothetical protein